MGVDMKMEMEMKIEKSIRYTLVSAEQVGSKAESQ